MPLVRVRALSSGSRVFLKALAVGILVLLVWDVFTHAWEPRDAASGALCDGSGGAGPVFGFALLLLGGLAGVAQPGRIRELDGPR